MQLASSRVTQLLLHFNLSHTYLDPDGVLRSDECFPVTQFKSAHLVLSTPWPLTTAADAYLMLQWLGCQQKVRTVDVSAKINGIEDELAPRRNVYVSFHVLRVGTHMTQRTTPNNST